VFERRVATAGYRAEETGLGNDVARVTAIDAHRVAGHLLRQAAVAAAGLAQFALAAGDHRRDNDFLADHVRAAADYRARDFVAERQRRLLHRWHAHVEVGQVGVADAAAGDLDHDVIGAEGRHGDFGALQAARLGHLPSLNGIGNHGHRLVRYQRFFQTGCRFSMKEFKPSLASSVAIRSFR
jgi:hypothetical protein